MRAEAFCAHLKEVMKLKAEYLRKWGFDQLKEDAKTAQENRRGVNANHTNT